MKRNFGISLMLNLALAMGLAFLLVKQHQTAPVPPTALPKAPQITNLATVPAPVLPHETVTRSFRWSDLDSSNGYRGFIANLRAIGCPETSIADIVRGNFDRAFSWERSRLRLDASVSGPWSRASENALINNLLVSSSPWLARDGNWNADARRTAASSGNQSSGGQRQQADLNGDHRQNSGSSPQLAGGPISSSEPPAVLETSANGQPATSDPYTMSSQDIMARQQAQYYGWYQPQVIAAAAGQLPLYINPDAFHPIQ
jgi:hypothetical protein